MEKETLCSKCSELNSTVLSENAELKVVAVNLYLIKIFHIFIFNSEEK